MYSIYDQAYSTAALLSSASTNSNCVIRTQWEALNCIQFPSSSPCLLTQGPDSEWDSSGLERKPQTLNLLTSPWHFGGATNNTVGNPEVDWLHLWSLFSDNVLPFNHALCGCSLQGWYSYQQLHHCLIVNAVLIGQVCFSVKVLIVFIDVCPSAGIMLGFLGSPILLLPCCFPLHFPTASFEGFAAAVKIVGCQVNIIILLSSLGVLKQIFVKIDELAVFAVC